eukprot:Nk52_evm29s249 gene=Nk52_evmTU29s249
MVHEEDLMQADEGGGGEVEAPASTAIRNDNNKDRDRAGPAPENRRTKTNGYRSGRGGGGGGGEQVVTQGSNAEKCLYHPACAEEGAMSFLRYRLFQTIGEGSFAKVKVARHTITGKQVAIKILDKKKIKDKYIIRNMYREAFLLRRIWHPNVIRLYEVFETSDQYFMVMEHVNGGELLDYILKKGKLDENETRRFMRQLVDAVSYIHSLGIVHRDLKVENFILDRKHANLKIIDFGLGNAYNPDEFSKTPCGSPQYSAPELISGKHYFAPGIDVWSLGINLYAMLTGKLPFKSDRVSHLHKLMVDKKYVMPPLSDPCKDLLQAFLEPEPTLRITLEDVTRHPWMAMDGSHGASMHSSTAGGLNARNIGLSCSRAWTEVGAEIAIGTAQDIAFNIPIQEDIVEQCVAHGMSKDRIITSVMNNALNFESCTYNLLLNDTMNESVLIPHKIHGTVSVPLHSSKTAVSSSDLEKSQQKQTTLPASKDESSVSGGIHFSLANAEKIIPKENRNPNHNTIEQGLPDVENPKRVVAKPKERGRQGVGGKQLPRVDMIALNADTRKGAGVSGSNGNKRGSGLNDKGKNFSKVSAASENFRAFQSLPHHEQLETNSKPQLKTTGGSNKNAPSVLLHKRVAKTNNGIMVTHHSVNPHNDFLQVRYRTSGDRAANTIPVSRPIVPIKAENLEDIFQHAADHCSRNPVPPISKRHAGNNSNQQHQINNHTSVELPSVSQSQNDGRVLTHQQPNHPNHSNNQAQPTFSTANNFKQIEHCLAKEAADQSSTEDYQNQAQPIMSVTGGREEPAVPLLFSKDSTGTPTAAGKGASDGSRLENGANRNGNHSITPSVPTTRTMKTVRDNIADKQVVAMTTKKPMSIFMKDISRALNTLDIHHYIEVRDNCFECSYRTIKFKCKVAKIPLKSTPSVNVRGLVLQRVKGDDSQYATLCRRLVIQLKDSS